MDHARDRVTHDLENGCRRASLSRSALLWPDDHQGRSKVLEYNVRFGDPETQAVLPRFKGDLLALFKEVAEGKLAQHKPDWSREPAITVILASGGYPGSYETGKKIEGVDLAKGVDIAEGVCLFHAGTKESGRFPGDSWREGAGCHRNRPEHQGRDRAHLPGRR